LDSETADDASDEDNDESSDDDLPAVPAPSRSRVLNGTGRKSHFADADSLSVAGSVDSMFNDYPNYFDEDDDPRLSPEENRKRFEDKIFANSDDEDAVYQAVDDISDSDDDNEIQVQEQELLAMISDVDNSEADDLLNQIDGLSAYGFGDDSDVSIQRYPSSQGSDIANDRAGERRVHFAVEVDPMFYMRMSESPTITRALLPAALPDHGVSPHVDRRFLGDAYDSEDSDLTDDCLPEEAQHVMQDEADLEEDPSPSTSSPSKKPSKKSPRSRGPPRGIFIDEGDKPSGILDPTGKIILMTNPHLLGEEFARRYGNSQTSSPDLGFAEIIDGSEFGDRDSGELVNASNRDIMLASLNTAVSDPSNLGQAIGPAEAFYPSDSIFIGDFVVDPDELEENFRPDEGLGEDVINLEDVIQFDDESDNSDAPTSPTIAMPPSGALPGIGHGNNEYAFVHSNNVTAFRRNADPAFAALSNTPSFRDMDFTSPFATPTPRRKRKNHASPYTSSHYQGVTPVQRMRDPNQTQSHTPDTTTPAKRRRLFSMN
jgi:hypothetical protein